jgi:hypothetical protein
MVEVAIKDELNSIVDAVQVAIAEEQQVVCPVKHLFTPGLYIREIVMPSGTVAVSKIHNSCHPFVVSKGSYAVVNVLSGLPETIEAPYTGVTTKGARRVFHIIEEVTLTTFHPFDFITGDENNWTEAQKEALAERIEEIIIDKREIKLEELT